MKNIKKQQLHEVPIGTETHQRYLQFITVLELQVSFHHLRQLIRALATLKPSPLLSNLVFSSFCDLRISATLLTLVRTTSRILAGTRFPALTRVVLTRSSSALAQEDNKMATPQEMSSNKMFGGFNRRFKHDSTSVGCPMTFTVYFPPAAETDKVPVLYWLSGLTCNDENFIQKAGAQRKAAAHGLALVSMDTSPRGLNVEGESESWDFGTGAGFYLNATQEKWKNWRMYDYVTKELPSLLSSHFPQLDTANASLFGHSMGGHGALTLFLKNPGKYKSVSAFAPICNPTQCPWGDKAFKGYLGEDKSTWEDYDATLLVKKYKGPKTTVLIDQGEADKFYKEKQLLPENFEAACESAGMAVELRIQPGYDHSYFFIASFVEDHIQHHAKALGL